VARAQEINPSNEPSAQLLAEVVRGGDWREVLRLWHDWVRVKSRILFYSCRNLFLGNTAEDVLGEVQDRFANKLSEIGYAECGTTEEILARTRAFLSYSLLETRTAHKRRKGREVHLGDQQPIDPGEQEKEDSFEKQMRLVFLRTCVEELQLQKQRQLGHLMLAGKELGDIATAWGASRQGVWNMFRRMKENLRNCIEMKWGKL